jgi:hypothetical protein
LHRSIVADVGISTPKQMAKTLVKFSARHPEFKFTGYVIPQVPGKGARSSPVHGVVESFLKSKKYIVPSAIASPVFAGCVLAVYEGTGAGRFNPARQNLVYSAERGLEPRLDEEDRRSYQIELNHMIAADTGEIGETHVEKTLARTLTTSQPSFDSAGRPSLRLASENNTENFGIAGSNLFGAESSGQFVRELMEARLHEELRKGNPPRVSQSDIDRDWNLMQKAMQTSKNEVADGLPEAAPGTPTQAHSNGNNIHP